MAKKKKGSRSKLDYFDTFMKQAQAANNEATLLVDIVDNFTTAEDIAKCLPHAHEIESEADKLNHAVMRAIDVDFVTPFDREDIIALANALDDIIDGIEEVIQRFYMFDIHFMHRDMVPMAHLLQKATGVLEESMGGFKDFKRFGSFLETMSKVNDVEEQVDAKYMEVMHNLFTVDRDNAVRVMVWKDLFEHVEECADRCDLASQLMGSIILKNS
jgi:predicted phosphate transport protein (TIGR00153 family)